LSYRAFYSALLIISVSEPVNEAVKEALVEDAEDLLSFDERSDEPLISYDEMVKRLKKDGRI